MSDVAAITAPSKTIAIFLDGTGNSADPTTNPTNVLKLFRGVKGEVTTWGGTLGTNDVGYLRSSSLDANSQSTLEAIYIPGVGTSGSDLTKLLGLAFADGITERVIQAYIFASGNYKPGDKLIINGFSRGAAEARALAGLIAYSGLLNLIPGSDDVTRNENTKNALAAWSDYRNARPGQDEQQRLDEINKQMNNLPAMQAAGRINSTSQTGTFRAVEIDAVGVFDTVCSVAVPLPFPLPGEQTNFPINFVDNDLSDNVKAGYHAVAISEDRVFYAPTYWNQRAGMKQVAFYGVHSNIGGGGPDKYLATISLNWMQAQLETTGLTFSHMANCTPQSADVTTPADWFPPDILDPVDYGRTARTLPHAIAIHDSLYQRVAGYPGWSGWTVEQQDSYGNSLICLKNSGCLNSVQPDIPTFSWVPTVPIEPYKLTA